MYNENNDGSFLHQPRLWLDTLSPKHRGSGMAAIPKTEIVTFTYTKINKRYEETMRNSLIKRDMKQKENHRHTHLAKQKEKCQMKGSFFGKKMGGIISQIFMI